MWPFNDSVMDTFKQFESGGYAEKLKAQITSTSLPRKHQDLHEFLYNQIIKFDGMFFIYICTQVYMIQCIP